MKDKNYSIEAARHLIISLGLPRQQQNERSAQFINSATRVLHYTTRIFRIVR